jgi:hypothetical protein
MSEEAAVVVSAPTATPTTPKIEETESSAEVAQNGGGPPSRVRLTDKQLETITKEELLTHWRDQDAYVDTIESQSSSLEGRQTLVLLLMICGITPLPSPPLDYQ